MASPNPPQGIQYAPSPWLKMPVTTYMFSFYSKPPLKDHAYSALEAQSSFADPAKSGEFKGGLGLLMVVRYHDTPVGPYDELLIVPGRFDCPGAKDANCKTLQLLRCTRIYVSQKHTQWNGRHAWNIPKHLARFSFTEDAGKSSSVTIRVYPPSPDSNPFFEAKVSKLNYLPSVPFSTNIAKYVGLDMRLAQCPLPRGADAANLLADGEEDASLCGTTLWRACGPEVSGSSKLCWIDVKLPKEGVDKPPRSRSEEGREATENDALLPSSPNGHKDGWWPNYKPWSVGLWVEGGSVSFEEIQVEGLGSNL